MTKGFCKELAELCTKYNVYLETDGSCEVIRINDLNGKKLEYKILFYNGKYPYLLEDVQ